MKNTKLSHQKTNQRRSYNMSNTIQYKLLDGTVSDDTSFNGEFDELIKVEFDIADYHFTLDMDRSTILATLEYLGSPNNIARYLNNLAELRLSDLYDDITEPFGLEVWTWSRFDPYFFTSNEIHPYEACCMATRSNINPNHEYIRINNGMYETTDKPDYESEAYEILERYLDETIY